MQVNANQAEPKISVVDRGHGDTTVVQKTSQDHDGNENLHQVPEQKFTKDDYHNMQTVAEAEDLVFDKESFVGKLSQSKIFDYSMPIGNAISITGNTLSFVSSIIPMGDRLKNTCVKAGEWCTNAFLHIIGLTNAVEQAARKNYFLSAGYLMENVVATFVPQQFQYLAKGFAVGPLAISLGIYASNGRSICESLDEHLSNLSDGFKRTFDFMKKDFFKNLRSSKTGLLSVLGGFTQIFGAIIWALSGNEKLGSIVRNSGGLCQDLEMIKLDHLKNKKHNYFTGGVNFTLATAADFLQHWLPDLKPSLVPLTFLTDGIGRYFTRKAQLSKELCATTDAHSKPFNVEKLFEKANAKVRQLAKPALTLLEPIVEEEALPAAA